MFHRAEVRVSRWTDTGYERRKEKKMDVHVGEKKKDRADHKGARSGENKRKEQKRKDKRKEKPSHGGQSSHRVPLTSRMTEISLCICLLK